MLRSRESRQLSWALGATERDSNQQWFSTSLCAFAFQVRFSFSFSIIPFHFSLLILLLTLEECEACEFEAAFMLVLNWLILIVWEFLVFKYIAAIFNVVQSSYINHNLWLYLFILLVYNLLSICFHSSYLHCKWRGKINSENLV